MTEPKPWPRAQTMPFVTAADRVQPHHLQAIAVYDEARGEATPRHHSPSMYTAAHINQAIEWWNKRAELEAAVAPEPISDERLAEIRMLLAGWTWHCGHREPERIVRELLAEVDRLRALQTPVFVTLPADAVTPDQVAEFNAAWQEMLQSPQEIIVLPSQATHWNAAEYFIGVDSADDSHDWVYVQHLPCETDVYSGRDDHELYTVDRLVGAMMAHRCEPPPPSDEFLADVANPIRLESKVTPFRDKPRTLDYPVEG